MRQLQASFGLNIFSLYGCIHTCDGCSIDKKPDDITTPEDIAILMKFLDNLENRNTNLYDVVLSPVDIFSALDLEDQLKRLSPILNRFKLLKVSAVLTYKPDLIKSKLDLIKKYITTKIYIASPLRVSKLKQDNYIQLLNCNLAFIRNELGEQLYYTRFKVNNDLIKENIDPSVDLGKHYGLESDLEYTLIDLTEANLDLMDLNNRLKFKQSIVHYRDKLNNAISTTSTPDNMFDLLGEIEVFDHFRLVNCFNFKPLKESAVIALNYKNGRFYYPLMIDDAVFINHPDFSIEIDSDLSVIDKLEAKVYGKQLTSIQGECNRCTLSPYCLKTGIILAKEIIKEKDCLLPDRAKYILKQVKNEQDKILNPVHDEFVEYSQDE